MDKLPEKFPEYSIMYNTISNQIKSLEKQKEDSSESIDKINLKIQTYQEELDRIRKMFPDSFFEVI